MPCWAGHAQPLAQGQPYENLSVSYHVDGHDGPLGPCQHVSLSRAKATATPCVELASPPPHCREGAPSPSLGMRHYLHLALSELRCHVTARGSLAPWRPLCQVRWSSPSWPLPETVAREGAGMGVVAIVTQCKEGARR
jgi:hypothetical protein